MFSFQVGSLLNIALILGTVLGTAALLIWVERRLLGFFNDRLGPTELDHSESCSQSLMSSS